MDTPIQGLAEALGTTVEEPTVSTGEVENEPTETPSEEEFDTITYNKEEVKIPVSERKDYLQKGYNYDKLHGKYEETSSKLKEYDEWVRNNFEFKDFKEYQNAYEKQLLEQKKQEYLDKGYDEKDVDLILSQSKEMRELQAKLEKYEFENEKEKVKGKIEAEIAELSNKHGLDAKTVDDIRKLENGDEILNKAKHMSLEEAYFLVNRDSLIGEAKTNATKSAIANVQDRNHLKPVDATKEELDEVTERDKELAKQFGTDLKALNRWKKAKRR